MSLLSTLNRFFARVFSEATTQKNFEKQVKNNEPYLHVQEISRKYMAKFLQSKTVACSVYNKNLTFYGSKL